MSSFRSNTPSQKKPSFLVRFLKGTFFQIFIFFTTVIVLGVAYASWTTLSPSQGGSGQPVNQTLVQGIINNINDLDGRVGTLITNLSTLTTRVTAVESQTTGGTVTGPLRWSSEYSGKNYEQAWTACVALAPAGSWRLPSEDDIEIGRHLNAGLFSAAWSAYWSSSPGTHVNNTLSFSAWGTGPSVWYACSATLGSTCISDDTGIGNGQTMRFRCVSNS